MAITLSTAARNAACDGIVDLMDAGSADLVGDFEFLEGATPIVVIEVDDPAFGAAVTGAAALLGTPHSAAATASTSVGVDAFNARDRDNGTVFDGTVTGTGGGGDIEFDNASVNNGQTVNLTGFTLTVP